MSVAQNAAADPRASAFLTANAGSGKTSTLVNRVARLLLGGARPEYILCVTYTKAAAAEMQGRLFERLGHWAVADDEALARDLRDIDEAVRDLPRARALFARALETPGGLKIQTIHAFCEKLLRRFPLEADLSPAFQVLDDRLGRQLAEAAGNHLLLLDGDGHAAITAARDRLIRRLKAGRFQGLLSQFVHQHDKIRDSVLRLLAHDDWRDRLFHGLGLDGVCTSHDCLAAYAEKLEWRIVRDVAEALAIGRTATNQKAGRDFLVLRDIWHGSGRLDFDLLRGIYLTARNEPKKNPFTGETAAGDRILLDRIGREVVMLQAQVRAADIAADTLDAIDLFKAFSVLYQALKSGEGALDFQDLINRARDLLGDEMRAQWVLYKLDGGLEHVLVDEAQDTSEDQWAIVRALTSEFFSGHGQTGRPRTVFAVGDEKQSIYGFQGAQPERFHDAGQGFHLKAVDAGAPFDFHVLLQSYRSLPEILSFVDAVFDHPDHADALSFQPASIVHQAIRDDARAWVELWPQVTPIDAPDATADGDDIAPVDQPSRHQASKRLARQIAATVAGEIAAGRAIWTRGKAPVRRAMHAGDVLILVRKRDHLFEHIIRELKLAGVAVSGADRLRLDDHIAFQDLRALMRFCLQPTDDLSLACVLRSPMCGLDEVALYDLAQPRSGTLWSALLNHPYTDDVAGEAKALLLWALRSAHNLTAFDFLARVLNRRDGEGRSLRQRFLTRLGNECDDVLDETLSLALKAEGAGITGLSACLDLFEFSATEIKREQEEGGSSVRVMTVHGSKGLEAPWVILPMAPQNEPRGDDALILADDGDPYLCASRKDDTAAIAAIRAARARKNEQEGLRLFYVALTRARDRLTLCGYLGRKAGPAGIYPPWYDLAAAAFDRLPGVVSETMVLAAPFDDQAQMHLAQVRVYGERAPVAAAETRHGLTATVLPAFAHLSIGQPDIDHERWQAISQMGDEDRTDSEHAPSPLELRSGLGRYRRGNLIHKLFEILPDIATDRRISAADRYLGRQSGVRVDQREEIRDAVLAVLNDARFADAFGPQSRPEVAVAGQIGLNARGEPLLLSGRIDRLVVTPDRVVIIDYKSNRPAPARAEDAAIAYQRQMAGYVALLRQIHPGKAVEAALLWTDGPRLTPLSDALISLRLEEIQSRLGKV